MRSINGKSIVWGTAAAMLLVAGCGTDQGTGLLALSISADTSIPPAAATSLVLSLEGKKTRSWPGTFPPIGGGAILLEFPKLSASDSPTNITVQAFDSSNCLVGAASKQITIKAGEKTSSDIVLSRSAVACGDGAAQPVADAMADGAGRADLPQLAGDGAQAAEAGLDGNFLRDSTGQDAIDTPQSSFFDGGQTADSSDSARSEVVDARVGAEIQDDTPIGGGDVIGAGGMVGSGGVAGHGAGGTTGTGGMASSGGIAGGGSGGINGAGGIGITGGVTSRGSGGTDTGGIVASGGVAGDGSGGINGTGGVTGSGGITNPGSGGTGTGGTGTGGTGSGGTGGTGGTISTCAGTVCGQDCCSAGQRCSGGTCICDAESCTGGCCQDRVCVGYTNQDNSRCGNAGDSCQPCPAAAQSCQSGQCKCPPGQSPCGTSCVDEQNDSSNCGGCGSACAAGQRCVGGQCTCDAASCSNGCCAANTCYDYASQDVSKCGAGGGSCGPCSINAPSTVTCALGRCLATLAIDPLACSITVDSSYVYWTEWVSNGKVRKAPIVGGNSSDVYVGASGDQPFYIINDTSYLYFGTSDNHSRNLLIKVSKSGGASTLFNMYGGSFVGPLGQDSGYIYLFESVTGGDRLDKVSKSTGSFTPSSWVTTYEMTPIVYGSTIYWYSAANESTPGTIRQSSTSLAAPSTLVPDMGDAAGLAVDASGLYVTDYTGLVRRVSPSDGEITLLASGQARPSTIVSDDSSLYWINPGNGTVMKMSKGGGDPVVLASISSGRLTYFGDLAVDGTSVYVSTCSGSYSDSIMKITPK